ncbi:MAG: DNA polymerase III subunit beta [Lachnospiraceae bacterium]|nr:DNA polymerase III subunit beta [Lachnospiraceae bacterium]
MRIQKSELAGKINNVKNIVPKSTTIEAIQGVLIEGSYLIANNMETAAKVKIDGSTDTPFIIPNSAFNLISSLPDGEMEITPGKGCITIKEGSIKNMFSTREATDFQKPNIEKSDESKSFVINSEDFLRSIKRVAFAIGDNDSKGPTSSLCLRAKEGMLNYIALDGHIVAWDQMEYEGDFELLIPRNTVDKLLSIGLEGDMTIEYSSKGALFITEECEVSTRLVSGTFFDVSKMLSVGTLHTTIKKAAMVEALNRIKTCVSNDSQAVKLAFTKDSLNIAMRNSITDYNEEIMLTKDIEDELTIAFNPKLLSECIRAMDGEEVNMTFNGAKAPLMIRTDSSAFLTVVLPVNLGGAA